MDDEEVIPSPRIIDDDEVIADSEEEGGNREETEEYDIFFQTAADNNSTAALERTSSVSAFTDATTQQQKAQGIPPSAISAFTATVPGTSRGKKPAADTSIESISASISGFPVAFDQISSALSTNIADRAKMRQRSQKKPILYDPDDVIELTSDDDEDELSLKPSTSKSKPKPKEKEKERPRPKPKPKAKKTTEEIVKDSSEDKVSDYPTPGIGDPAASTSALEAPNPRSRPRPRPKKKRPRTPDADDRANNSILPPLTPAHGPEIPIATSPPVFPFVTDLPPSDPPAPSVSTIHTAYTDRGMRIPPIETLQNYPTSDKQAPSSPDSLFSEHGSFTSHLKKRKRPIVPHPDQEEEEIDQLIPSSHSKEMLPPPPTFFAGSSSVPINNDNVNERTNTTANYLPQDVVDLTMLPPTMVPASGEKLTLKIKKPSVPTTKKKKTKLVHDDLFDDAFDAAPPIILDEDDADDDFDPAGDGGAKKGKAKAKVAKEKKPKEKKERQKKDKGKDKTQSAIASAHADTTLNVGTATTPGPHGRPQVEVVITSKPPSTKKKEKAKDKGKTKVKDKDKDKEVFKSREFIEDSEDELSLDFSGAPPTGSGVPETPTVQKSKSVPKPAETQKPVDTDPASMPVSPKVTSPDISSKRRVSGVKRKAIMDSDDEDEDFEEKDKGGRKDVSDDADVIHVTKSKKRKTDEDKNLDKPSKSKEKPKGKGKAKQIVLSDEEEYDATGGGDSYTFLEDQEDVSAKKTKGKGKEKEPSSSKSKGPKSSLTVPTVNGDENHDQGQDIEKNKTQPKKSTSEETPVSAKENMTPAVSRPTYATPNPVYATPAPRPATVTGAGSLNRRSSTPLYANYTIAPRKSSRPMSELIRHVNSLPGSPFPSPHPGASSSSSASTNKIKPLLFRTPTSTAYNPMLKSQRSLLSKIAPLHPNRRTPPPPPPPPPPRKKSKKELEMEEKWEEEMIDDVGGMEAWAAMGDDERKEMRKMKWAREMNGWDE